MLGHDPSYESETRGTEVEEEVTNTLFLGLGATKNVSERSKKLQENVLETEA